MPIIKSAKKRVRTAGKAAVRNSKTKRNIKDTLRALHRAVTGKKDAAQSKAQSAIDKAVKKGVVHKNKAARKQRQIAKAGKAAAGTKKAVVKKPAAKKVAAKKPVTKKAVAKKTVVKKK